MAGFPGDHAPQKRLNPPGEICKASVEAAAIASQGCACCLDAGGGVLNRKRCLMSRLRARMAGLLPSFLFLTIALIALDAVSVPAAAQEWRVNKSKSQVLLQLSMEGQPVEGRFSTYKFDIRFDPEEASDGQIAAAIDASSLATGVPALDAQLFGQQWLNAGAHPLIRINSVGIREKGAPEYQLSVDLTLKGVTKRITARLTIDDEGTDGKIHAEFRVNPAAFGIGQGSASGDLAIVIDLVATHLTN